MKLSGVSFFLELAQQISYSFSSSNLSSLFTDQSNRTHRWEDTRCLDFVAARWGVGWGEETADILRYGQTGRKYMQREENDVARHFYTHVQTCLATNQVVAGYEKFLQKVDKMFTRCALYPPKANLHGVIPAYFYPIRREYSRNLHYPDLFMKDWFESGWQNTQYRFQTSFVAMLQNKLHVFVAWFTVA